MCADQDLLPLRARYEKLHAHPDQRRGFTCSWEACVNGINTFLVQFVKIFSDSSLVNRFCMLICFLLGHIKYMLKAQPRPRFQEQQQQLSPQWRSQTTMS
jgi:hypothetical protein